jgi:AraC-like DNA-binding protein
VRAPFAWYREFAPCEALRADVLAFFSFGPEPAPAPAFRPLVREVAFLTPIICAPQLADGQVSVRFEVGQACDADGRWRADATAFGETVVGPMSGVGRTDRLDFSETVGAYFRPGCASRFFGIPLSDLADTSVAAGDIWGTRAVPSATTLAGLTEAARIDRVESFLVARLRHRQRRSGCLDVEGLAAHVHRRAGRVTVDVMARVAGVSRQHLCREFRGRIGVGPKLYSRLARFQSVLAHASTRARVDWARVAVDMGFADQSHLIAECRQFSGLTPQTLADRDWFHPFIERAKSRRYQ